MRRSEDAILLEIVQGAPDLGSLSDELHAGASDHLDGRHLHRSRANLLRPFALSSDLSVLEVGAGAGSVTRYLGETCGRVEAIEPRPALARVAEARTRDLDTVRVHVGDVSAIPPEARYDLIVVPDGSGTGVWTEIPRRLRPGGHVIWGVANAASVRRLAGSVEGPGSLTRPAVEAVMRGAGLVPTVYHAFPDHLQPRTLLADDALRAEPELRSLAWRIPHFPSPDAAGSPPRGRDEQRLWRALTRRGLGGVSANSFVLVGSHDREGGARELWPEGRLAAYFTTQRRARFATRTWVRRVSGGVRFERRRIGGEAARTELGGLILEPHDETFVPGTDLLDLLAWEGGRATSRWLRRWRHAHRRAVVRPPRLLDAGPRNTVVREDGSLRFIDQEWRHRTYQEVDLRGRHMLWLALSLAERSPRQRWKERPMDLAHSLGRAAGLNPLGEWLEEAIRREAEIQALVHHADPGTSGWRPAVSHQEALLTSLLGRTPVEIAEPPGPAA